MDEATNYTLHYIIILYILCMKYNIFKYLIYNFFVCLYILTGKFPKGFIIIFNIAIDYLKMLLILFSSTELFLVCVQQFPLWGVEQLVVTPGHAEWQICC